jgi:hypothetical protein
MQMNDYVDRIMRLQFQVRDRNGKDPDFIDNGTEIIIACLFMDPDLINQMGYRPCDAITTDTQSNKLNVFQACLSITT